MIFKNNPFSFLFTKKLKEPTINTLLLVIQLHPGKNYV